MQEQDLSGHAGAVRDAGDVCILLAMYNGADYLAEQLESFAKQDHGHWQLLAGDDASQDDGPDILRRFAGKMRREGRRVELIDGPCAGATANFLALLARSPDVPWIAFSDQDDVWMPDRLSRGIRALSALPPERPALYCSATLVTDENLQGARPSRPVTRPVGFRNALVQNIAAGNTLLLNRAAARLARQAVATAAAVPGLPAHDWWLYQLISGCDGTVIYDPEPTLYYRQHGHNQVGTNQGLRAGRTRMAMLVRGRFEAWTEANITALRAAADRLTPENRALVESFAGLRTRSFLSRLGAFARLRLYRQTRLGQSAIWLALAFGRV